MVVGQASLEQCPCHFRAAAVSGLSVATWNIHKGVGSDRKRDLNRTAAVIGEIAPDIMALQEADTRFGGRKGLLNLAALARDHGLVAVAVPGGGAAHGWNLVARWIADLRHQGHAMRVIGTHLCLLPFSRTAQTRHLVSLLAGLDSRPTLLMGDLNQWRAGESVAQRHLATHFQNQVALPSFPARYPMAPLDRIMIHGPARLNEGRVHDTPLARRASDHLPLTARLWLD